jgi:type 1 glutamine amidotransferase
MHVSAPFWMNWGTLLLSVVCAVTSFSSDLHSEEPATTRRKIVLLAGSRDDSHPPGTNEYETSLATLQNLLENSSLGSRMQVELHVDGWPRDVAALEDADTIVLFSSGSAQDENDHPLVIGDRWEVVRRQMDRGCGLVLLHGATRFPQRQREDVLEWVGGYSDDESDAAMRDEHLKANSPTTSLLPADSTHPVTLGWGRYVLSDSFLTRVRFRDDDPRFVPILRARMPVASGEGAGVSVVEPDSEAIVAWSVERGDGGRGFACTGGRNLDSLTQLEFRSMLLNAIVWSAKLPVPPSGLGAPGRRPIRAMVVTGHQYPGHLWRETTLALEDALRMDPRMQVDSIPDPEFLAMPQLHDYDVVLLNYCNWEQPEGLSEAAKENFVLYLEQGGGLVIVHFANGAFHFTLPGAESSDWPEWRTNICRRVWDHRLGKSGHDPYGRFQVDVADSHHSIMRGMKPFETIDELYFRQQGEQPVHVLATAMSRVTGEREPMAFVHSYGKGHIFQTVLGHSAESLRTEGTAELLRRGTAWGAQRLPKVPPFAWTIKLPDLEEDHFEGFQEDHVVDDRLQFMDTGPFFSGTIATPGGETWKGIVVRVGSERQASICYDTELLRVSGAWEGFLAFSPARFGLIQIPRPAAHPFLTTPRQPGWSHQDSLPIPRPHAPYGTLPRDWARYRGLHLHGDRVVFTYEVDGVSVWESPWWEEIREQGLLTRTLRIGPTERPLRMFVAQEAIPVLLTEPNTSWRLERDEEGRQYLVMDPHAEPRQITLVISSSEEVPHEQLEELARHVTRPPDLTTWTQPGPRRWLEILKTEGEVSLEEQAYVLDTLTMPYDNPYQALMFASGHDFFSNGDAAVCTVHGDVWRVSGIDDSLTELRWQRFATGLFQPLGLLVIDDRVHVVGRDQITILQDIDGDGEADFYQNFNNDGHVTANGHEYVTCLERDSEGWFYFLKGDSGGARRMTGVCSEYHQMERGFGGLCDRHPQWKWSGDWTR